MHMQVLSCGSLIVVVAVAVYLGDLGRGPALVGVVRHDLNGVVEVGCACACVCACEYAECERECASVSVCMRILILILIRIRMRAVLLSMWSQNYYRLVSCKLCLKACTSTTAHTLHPHNTSTPN
jgi:hypothetical protein